MKILTLLIGGLAIAMPAAASDMSDQILANHNAERSQVGVQPLKWNEDLARDAKLWADHLTATRLFEHSTTDDGENLWMGSTGAYSYSQMSQTWADEKTKFKFGTFPDVSTDGNWANVGHYTQMIWSTTTEIGCAKSTGNGWDVLVCRYRQPGNTYGQKPY